MYIESLQITSFASLSGFTLDLNDGINVVYGKNEAGKSTLAEFIRYVFYGFNNKSDRERHISFNSNVISGSIILRDGDKRYRVERKTLGAKDSCTVYDLDSGSICYEDKVPGEVFFGMPGGLFSSTAFIGQADGNRINGKSTSELLDNLLFAADEGISVKKALKKLDDAKVNLLYKNKKGGRIYELENELSSLNVRLEKSKNEGKDIFELEGKIKDYKEKLEYEEQNREILFNKIEDYKLKKSRERKQRLSSLEDAYKSATATLDEFKAKHTRNGFFPDQSYLDSLRDCASEVLRCDERIALTEKRLDNFNREMEKNRAEQERILKEYAEKRAKVSAKRSLCLALAVISLISSIVTTGLCAFMFIISNSGAGMGLGVLSVVLLGAMIGSFVLVPRYSSEIREIDTHSLVTDDGYEGRLEAIGGQLLDQRGEKDRFLTALNDLCARWNLVYTKNALSEMRNIIDDRRRLENEQEVARVAYVQMKTEVEENMADEPEDDGRELDIPDDFDYRDADRRLKLVEEMMRLKNRDKHQAEIDHAQLSSSFVSPSSVLEDIGDKEEEKKALTDRYNAYSLAAEKIEIASEQMRLSVSPRLSRGASGKMEVLTDGKYDEIGVNGEFLMTFRPISGDGRVTKDDSFMSAGTSDIAYVSLRLSLCELICGDNKLPPLVFDESFVRLDDNRLDNMLRLLRNQKGQMILLTSNDREVRALSKASIPHTFVCVE